MRKSLLVTILLLILVPCLHAQTTYRVHGKVTTDKLEPLAFVSVQMKQSQAGTITREDGTYELSVEEGTYDMMVSMVGYKPQTLKLTVNQDYQQNIILEEDDTRAMEDIVIRVKLKDRSEEYVRNVIQHKDEIVSAAGAYSTMMYIKAIQHDSILSRKERKKDTTQFMDPNADLTGMAMAEISIRLDYESEQRLKEARLGVKKTGNANNLFYTSATEGNFSFYNNLVKVPSVSPTPFLSPLSYSGLVAYKFKTIKTERKNGRKLYTISVKPRQISNATVEGEMVIQDSSWVVLSTRFSFPSYHLPEYDFFQVAQEYDYIQNKAWVMTKQEFTYYSKSNKRKLSGQTLVVYKDHELNKEFSRRYFGVEVSATAQQAYEKDSTFWETVRAVPLTEKEIRFIRYRDSIYRVTHTEAYLDSLDRANNKMTWKKVAIFGSTIYNRKKERTYVLPPVISLYEPFQFGGGRIHPTFYYFKRYASRKDLSLFSELSYGFRNKDINGSTKIQRMYNPFNRGFYMFDIHRGFDRIYEGDNGLKSIQRDGYFLNNYIAAGHGLEVLNGFQVYTEALMAIRQSVADYKTNEKWDSILVEHLDNNSPIAFNPYNAFYTKLTLKYTPRQRYVKEPLEKIILGSKWPTAFVTWRSGIPNILKSEADFQYLEFGLEQKINFGLLGSSRYTVKSGDFINQEELKLLDYSWMREGDPLLFMNPDEAFQALDSTFAVFDRTYQGHLVHEFNGAFINKIPLFKKLGLREIAGAGFLIAPERDLQYYEAFAGIERIFKWPFNPLTKFKLGVYVVGSWANQFQNPVQFKIGFTTWDKKNNKWN